MAKVKCRVCANEDKGVCKIKKIGIKLNKDRLCNAYIYDEKKMKAKQTIPSIYVSYSDREEARKKGKLERAEVRKMAQEKPADKAARNLGLIPQRTVDQKHPLTGDLSRFVSSATKDTANKE